MCTELSAPRQISLHGELLVIAKDVLTFCLNYVQTLAKTRVRLAAPYNHCGLRAAVPAKYEEGASSLSKGLQRVRSG